jgi:hypothetical protein
MAKHHFNTTQGGGFDFYDFKKALALQFGKQNAEFFAMAFREQAGAFLEQSSRFSKLVDWCDKEIRRAGAILNIFSPADKTDEYTTAQVKLWRDQVDYVAELVYFRELLVNHNTTTAQRENIEYTICKLYAVHYDEYLGDYV